ncbi:RAD51-associated protein 1-like isoform X2 [Mya arenaria]|uniref:RAD51-associated protein 1-like isoform X2 n=1 Tax=Mya arenaria TaxID=6604 RepID=UPI0022E6600D|nr:RAD51-associated protein 1-like isoform X2 [Mya arenaria]
MSERKSIRARKAVDYGKFGGGCSDDDDDFADCTPPVPKKAKLSSNKENKMQKPDKQSKVKETKSRKSVQEKVFERELQEALQLSMSQSDGSQSQEEVVTMGTPPEAPPILEREAPSPVLPVIDCKPVSVGSIPVLRDQTEDGDIVVIEEDVVEKTQARRRMAKPKKYVDSDSESEHGQDSDFAVGEEVPSSDDDDGGDDDNGSDDDFNASDSDSDFGSSKKKKAAKPQSKKAAAKPPNQKKEPKATTAKPKAALLKSKSGLSGAPLATSSPIAGKPDPVSKTPTPARPAKLQQNWKPPGSAIGTKSPAISKVKSRQVLTSSVINSPVPSGACLKSPSLGGVNIKSPNTGLRIGLSRNMKLKPLHPNLKISN